MNVKASQAAIEAAMLRLDFQQKLIDIIFNVIVCFCVATPPAIIATYLWCLFNNVP